MPSSMDMNLLQHIQTKHRLDIASLPENVGQKLFKILLEQIKLEKNENL